MIKNNATDLSSTGLGMLHADYSQLSDQQL